MYAMDFNKQVAIREETKVGKFEMMSFPGRTKTLSIFSSSNQYINRDKIKKLYVMSTTACLSVSGENCINILSSYPNILFLYDVSENVK